MKSSTAKMEDEAKVEKPVIVVQEPIVQAIAQDAPSVSRQNMTTHSESLLLLSYIHGIYSIYIQNKLLYLLNNNDLKLIDIIYDNIVL